MMCINKIYTELNVSLLACLRDDFLISQWLDLAELLTSIKMIFQMPLVQFGTFYDFQLLFYYVYSLMDIKAPSY